jgi:hypothetical protein
MAREGRIDKRASLRLPKLARAREENMAEIEIGPLTDRLGDDEIAELAARMEKLGAPQLPHADNSEVASVGDGLDENVLSEFLDRLEGHDAAAEIYLPVEFDGNLEVAGLRVASTPILIDVLEELKDELDSEAEEEEEEEDDAFEDDRKILTAQLRQAWKLFYQGAQAAMERHLPLHVKP